MNCIEEDMKNDDNEFSYNLLEIEEASNWVINKGLRNKIWCFYGEMGVGKTTLIQSICMKLGVIGGISSPTYSIVNEYPIDSQQVIFHFDFYRIKSLEEAYDIGVEEYFDKEGISLIEWPEKIESLLIPENPIRFKISNTNEIRTIRVI